MPEVRSPLLSGAPLSTLAIGGALALWLLITSAGALAAGESPFEARPWHRYDSGHYVEIAEDGYSLAPCVDVPNRGPDDWCGTTGWFPGYPYLMRLLGAVGLSSMVAGRLLSMAALLGMLATLWFGFLRYRPLPQGLAGMALAAAFPSSVYYGAIFPISLALVCILGCLALVEQRRWPAAGLLGAGATIAYTSGITIGAVAAIPLLDREVGPWRERIRGVLWLALAPALAYVGVAAEMHRTTGHWDAWFKAMAGYRLEPTSPITAIRDQIARLGPDDTSGWIGLQTIVVLLIVVATGVVAWRRWSDLGLGERATVPLVAALWIIPLTLGAALSLWRAESLLLPAVILLSRLRARYLWPLVAVATVVGYQMARLYFDHLLA